MIQLHRSTSGFPGFAVSFCGLRAPRRAFTLIEIMASVALLSLLVILLAGMARSVTSAWVANEGQTEAFQNVRVIGDIVARDVAAALLPVEPSSTDNLQFLLNAGISGDRLNRDALFFQAPVSDDTRRGDIAEIGYFVRWVNERDASGGRTRPVARLCRFYVPQTRSDPANPDKAYVNPDFLIYSGGDWLANVDSLTPADSANDYRGMLAENVIGLWIRPLEKDGTVLGDSYDSRKPRPNTNPPLHTLPAQVEISFVMIDSRSAQRIDEGLQAAIESAVDDASEGSGDASPADRFLANVQADTALNPIRQGLRGYTTRVSLSNSIK